MILFSPDKCTWCDTDLEECVVPGTRPNLDDLEKPVIEPQLTVQYCPNPECRWYDALPARYDSEPGWRAMNNCWRI